MTHIVSSAKVSGKHQQRLRECFPEVRFTFYENIEQVAAGASDAEVLITYGEDLDSHTVRRFSRLRWIHVISAGVELLPFDTLRSKGIRVTNARGIHAVPMGEYALAVLLQLTRRVHDLYLLQKEKKWDRTMRMDELAGKTLGIIGAGAIGQGIARRARAFDMRIWGLNTSGRSVEHVDHMFTPAERKSLLQESDYIIVTLPLTPLTHHFIGERELGWMRSDAYLINMARGSAVDERALLRALQENRIAGAVLDVFTAEPLPPGHPFWELDNVILTPHVSGRSPLYMTRALEIFETNLSSYRKGSSDLRNEINLEKGY